MIVNMVISRPLGLRDVPLGGGFSFLALRSVGSLPCFSGHRDPDPDYRVKLRESGSASTETTAAGA